MLRITPTHLLRAGSIVTDEIGRHFTVPANTPVRLLGEHDPTGEAVIHTTTGERLSVPKGCLVAVRIPVVTFGSDCSIEQYLRLETEKTVEINGQTFEIEKVSENGVIVWRCDDSSGNRCEGEPFKGFAWHEIQTLHIC